MRGELPEGRLGHSNAFKRVVQQERDCESFTPWQQGFTPKEHREMLDQQVLREWQAKREDADRQWRREREAEDKRFRTKELRWMVGAIVVAALLGAVVGALAQRLQ